MLTQDTSSQTRSPVKLPATVFKSCPVCDSPNVRPFAGGQLRCNYCGWTSVPVYEELLSKFRSIPQFSDFSLATEIDI
jgi:hypothetical protein